jgi:hypothetical protein
MSKTLSLLSYGYPETVRILSKSIILLLPSYLDGLILLFTGMGFAVVHSYDSKVLEMEIKEFDIDLALEWQHGPEDYPIRDMLRKCKREIPVLLTLNWNGRLPSKFSTLGYRDYVSCPWTIDGMMSKFYGVLPESKKPMLKDIWERAKKRCGK